MSHGWGPSYGDPSHPTTGELPEVGDGVRGTGEFRTVQIDIATDSSLRRMGGDAGGSTRLGDSQRGEVSGLTVQIDHIKDPGAKRPKGDTQLLPRITPKPGPERVPAAESQPGPSSSRSMPVQRRQLGPDWTQMPLRLLAAAVVTLAVLGVSAASLITIAEWINP
ncbi:hypothetical protein L0U85_11205 [Glycomyces sp. L485]|uniref:hypothetical protein n=1 Tax=Glycomyces sp. L485 TaxID=2909235 RepID=UPI001F4AA225|nr:hypothetical protein [Glycomyces sp. L485]MCH7231411.1 hypothetical protein [Glycomyces sp. L485]